MPKIVTSGNVHFVPILKELNAKGWEIVSIHPQFTQSLINLDIAAASIVQAADQEIKSRAIKLSSRINAELDRREYMGNHLLPPVKDFLNTEYPAFVYTDLPDIIMFVLLLAKVDPDIIIVHNDVEQVHRAAGFWSRTHGKPCLHIPHAIYQDVENKYDIHRIVTATDLASAGNYQSGWYLEAGMPADHIYETGLPQFDKYAALQLDRRRARLGLGIENQNMPVVCYASSWRQDTNVTGMHDGVSETYGAILECTKQMTDVRFIIKTHPNGRDAQQHLDRAREVGARVIVTAEHLPQCLMASDLLFAYGPSNTILEGAHVPWLRLACSSGYDREPEVLKIPTDPPDIGLMCEAFRHRLAQPPQNTDRLLSKYLGLCDGMNWQRIALLVQKLVEIGASNE